MGFGSSQGVFSDLDQMTIAERKKANVLIVDPELQVRSTIRTMLVDLGYGQVKDTADHVNAVELFQQRHFSHVIFDAKETTMPAREFLLKIRDMDPDIIAIPSSYEPTVDDVFTLLIEGAQGYLVKPVTPTTLEQAVALASKGEPLSEAILYAKDRNQALAALAMTALDKVAVLLRQSERFETARLQIPTALKNLTRAVDLGKTFAQDGTPGLLEAYVEFALDRASGPASRLGRTRLRRHRHKEVIKSRLQESEDLRKQQEEEAERKHKEKVEAVRKKREEERKRQSERLDKVKKLHSN